VLKPRAVGLLPVCLTMKPVGEPDALIGHVRFDERGWETERCRMAQATAPILDSTIADMLGAAAKVRYRGDSVAKLPKCRAINFPRKDETSDNRRSMQPQTRYRNRVRVWRTAA